jgi:hypothetical protein
MYLPLLMALFFSVSSLAQSTVRENAHTVGTIHQAPSQVQPQAPSPSAPKPAPRANGKSRKP